MILTLASVSTGFSREKVKPGAVILQEGIFFTTAEARAVLLKLDRHDSVLKQLQHYKNLDSMNEKEFVLFKKEIELEKREAGIYKKETEAYKELTKVTNDALIAERRAKRGSRVENFILKGILFKVLLGGIF